KGGGAAVGKWARDNGFTLTPDSPEVLDFYAKRSPIFMAAKYDTVAARARGQLSGQGTAGPLTIPAKNPWGPLPLPSPRLTPTQNVEADVFLLTDKRPALLSGTTGLDLSRQEPASTRLLDDLRNDSGMSWVPRQSWFSYVKLDVPADKLRYDLAIDASGQNHP